MEYQNNENELSLKRNAYTTLLINFSIKALAWLIVFLLIFLCICIYVEYYNGFRGNSLFGIFNINYLLFSLKHNLNKLYIKDEITVEIVGMGIMEMKRLKSIMLNKEMNADIFSNIQDFHNNNINNRINFEVRDTYFEFNDNITNEILTGERVFEDKDVTLNKNNHEYFIYVSFKNCVNEKFKNTLNIYNGRYSFFCLSNETSPSEFLILLNDVIEIWFTKFVQGEISKLFEYNSIDLYINNLIDTKISLVKNITLQGGDYYLKVNNKNDKNEILFINFLIQLGEAFNINIKTQNKYLNLSENEVSAFVGDDYAKLYKLFNGFGLNQQSYGNNYDNKFNLNLVNYYYTENHYSKEINNREYCTDIKTDSGFLLTCLDINDDKYSDKALIHWIKYIRSLLLHESDQTKETNFEFKSRLGDKYTINTQIKQINKTLLFTEWQISLFKLIRSKYAVKSTVSNINRFFSSLRFYNIYKLPQYIILTISYLNKQLSEINREKGIKSGNLYSALSQDSYNLLFNSDIFNYKTYNYDLITAVYSPVIAPLIFIVFITMFRIIRFSKK
ncbi:hypothetical protein FG379_000020 [Cryptosporidium bovis]|uniref:uncharacterized protein n=1 Tax=Cryptosporidium bovis TaxID=310047 RepID=UPI00351AA752|nr:hypothetical protein FG379_000020 [Cryptosporidium bovis]